ncbi:hypothetical protein LOZ04_005086 [Ophidiomyces ophidiicola]|nr:hypothetical protein LOZ56_001605 [Ophidiomyces ophidiicola]KAI2018733.1 hypothetical protein LOZ45_005819 [Ophidiomyces ophidiicola]KAI2094295.1 hypothetical protein LOZ33_004635 [Ophidiomyces ophidiicola]KAI2102622.1 hypothetical protein LOZ34_005446 [Ophidiomyces ophidiicola]KAI2114029.1 hypothetical protein LOZ32_005226 [Ophidiomyces ophidiicola]
MPPTTSPTATSTTTTNTNTTTTTASSSPAASSSPPPPSPPPPPLVETSTTRTTISVKLISTLRPRNTADCGIQVSMPATVFASRSDSNSPVAAAAAFSPSRAPQQDPRGSPGPVAHRSISWSSATSVTQHTTSSSIATSPLQPAPAGPGHKPPRTSPAFLRRLSPNLAARVKLLDVTAQPAANAATSSNSSRSRIGRIPEEHLKELDSLHRDLSIKVQKKGRAWGGAGARSTTQTPEPASASERDEAECVEPREPDNPAPGSVASATHSTPQEMSIADESPRDRSQRAGDFRDSLSIVASVEQKVPEPGLRRRDSDRGPTPPPKDSPPVAPPASSTATNVESYFNPLGLHRTDSIYSLSRASFSNQLSQLTSIILPQPATLEASIAAIPTASAAVKALTQAAEQIQKWINKSLEVLGGLDADDDVEWAAAGGREGLDDVDKAITKFESLVNVYVKAIEDVQLRNDIADVGANQLNGIVIQMESTLQNWANVRSLLRGVKQQVGLAMEWEELWNAVLGDVGLEIENLARLIFEMEEKRHRAVISDMDNDPAHGLDINELETIVEESPANGNTPSNPNFSFAPVFPPGSAQLDLQTSQSPQDEATLLALFARMQPLRASLDFLPMRLSMFRAQSENTFPSACDELDDRRQRLESGYRKLEMDAEALRRELGEDRWIIVFRNAGKQAQKMCESVERSVNKLQEAIHGGIQHSNPAALAKRAENFEAKKEHYGSAIERVFSIIQKGINDRLTVNGEVIRLLADLRARYESLQEKMRAMDAVLDELAASRHHNLRDSVSTVVTMDTHASRSAFDTPESSPASSVIMANGASSATANGSRRSSATGNAASRTPSSKYRRYSALPQPVSPPSQTTRRQPAPRSISTVTASLKSPAPKFKTICPSPTPPARPASRTSGLINPLKPRWNNSANTSDLVIGHAYGPLSPGSPSTTRRLPVPSRSISHQLAPRSPLSRESSASPLPGHRPHSRVDQQHHRGRSGAASPAPRTSSSSLIDPPPYSKLRKQSPGTPTPAPGAARSRLSYMGGYSSSSGGGGGGSRESSTPSRPGTAMGHASRRVSLLPMPKGRSGRESAAGDRPPWRH